MGVRIGPEGGREVAGDEEAFDAVRRADDRRWQAMMDGDITALGDLLDDTLLFTYGSALTYTRSAALEALTNGASVYTSVHRSDEVFERVTDDVVVMVARLEIGSVVDDHPSLFHVVCTATWVRRADGWRLAAFGSTPVPSI
jgi:hypothetical protein